jgi:glycosyltransferase involved in cell wall biosynthesis
MNSECSEIYYQKEKKYPMSEPLISIVIPVYNVEKYLRECLDSVVNQTMREIQIICVNDGSTDSSPAILEEYAQKDKRIEVIHQKNAGVSAARNAAYPYLKGEYTLFIDSDDWVDLQLCKKVYQKMKESEADVVLFSYVIIGDGKGKHFFSGITPEDKIYDKEKKKILHYTAAAGKVWKTDFLLKNHLFFPEGVFYEDTVVYWQGILLAEKISVLPEELYYYRQREGSTTHKDDETTFDLFAVYRQIEMFLKENGYYSRYRNIFLEQKLGGIHYRYFQIKDELKQVFCQKIREIIGTEEKEFIKKLSIREFNYKLFYSDLIGDAELQRSVRRMLPKYFWRHPGKIIPWIKLRWFGRKTVVNCNYEF